jgi:hypothetical protein
MVLVESHLERAMCQLVCNRLVAADRLSFGEARLLCDTLRGLRLWSQFIERTSREMRELIQAEQLDQRWVPARMRWPRV